MIWLQKILEVTQLSAFAIKIILGIIQGREKLWHCCPYYTNSYMQEIPSKREYFVHNLYDLSIVCLRKLRHYQIKYLQWFFDKQKNQVAAIDSGRDLSLPGKTKYSGGKKTTPQLYAMLAKRKRSYRNNCLQLQPTTSVKRWQMIMCGVVLLQLQLFCSLD